MKKKTKDKLFSQSHPAAGLTYTYQRFKNGTLHIRCEKEGEFIGYIKWSPELMTAMMREERSQRLIVLGL